MKRPLVPIAAALFLAAGALPAFAGECSVHNDTGWDFKVESGNTSNQSVDAHTETSIESGHFKGKSEDGKSISGTCHDGEHIEITEKDGDPDVDVRDGD